jgi:hypothetical protein
VKVTQAEASPNFQAETLQKFGKRVREDVPGCYHDYPPGPPPRVELEVNRTDMLQTDPAGHSQK